ncbi:MAG: hypothetical protein STSR0008_22780 [Ignavibacterium sp.]
MKEFKHTNPDYCDPPGAFREILAHPIYLETKAIEKVIIKEHRFAFFYWIKWYRELIKKTKLDNPPVLITIDYHRDLASSDGERSELEEVDKYNLSELAMFCWARMNPLNDGHILSAAYLNVIDDIILLKQQESFDDSEDLVFNDKFNNEYHIYEFDNFIDLEKHVLNTNYQRVFFDIDLDYFIKEEGIYLSREGWTIMSNEKIKEIINPKSDFMKWIYNRIEGFTIATEPAYCGSLLNSFRILSVIEEQLFDEDGHWKY